MYTLYLTLVLMSGAVTIPVGQYHDELQCVAESGNLILTGIDKELLICERN